MLTSGASSPYLPAPNGVKEQVGVRRAGDVVLDWIEPQLHVRPVGAEDVAAGDERPLAGDVGEPKKRQLNQ